jgi:hypothetical protein
MRRLEGGILVVELFDSKDIRAYEVFYTQSAAPHVAPHVEPT